jgi:hypothetical protein
MRRRGWTWVTRHGQTVVLVTVGLVLLVASLFQGKGHDVFAVGLLVFGTSLVVLGVVLPRLQNAEMGPATGLKLSLSAERETSTRLAETEQVEVVAPDEIVSATRLVVASELLERMLAPDDGPLAGALFHLYLFDEERDLLLPAFEGRPSFRRGWRVGRGAVGEAWASGQYVLARGPEVSDDTFGLTPDQQRRYRELAVVAAMPVTNARGEVMAVLAGSSPDPGSPLGSAESFDAQLLMAQEVARVLVDLLQWFTD